MENEMNEKTGEMESKIEAKTGESESETEAAYDFCEEIENGNGRNQYAIVEASREEKKMGDSERGYNWTTRSEEEGATVVGPTVARMKIH